MRPAAQTLTVTFECAAKRVLAEEVAADRDPPAMARAVRDGFAVRADDLTRGLTLLRVVGQVRAGDSYDLPVASGEAVEIMTGAALPSMKNPLAWLDHASSGICVFVNHSRDSGSLAEIHPAHGASTIRARLKLLLTTLKP